ncbi:MAG: toll/interleukin-1 receptor domain-containing protein [Actinoplanes sp.]
MFLSYRRADSEPHARALRDALIAAIPGVHVFRDAEALRPGDDFPREIYTEIGRTDLFLALIGPAWLGPRIDDERDYVRAEVAAALERGVPVLPVRVDDGTVPAPADLPLDIGMISRLNASLSLHTDNLAADCVTTVQAVRELLQHRPHRPAATVPDELVGTWVSAATGDALLQYDLYANGTYQHVGISRQQVSNGVFEFEVTHEGAVTFAGDAVVLEAFRAAASRRHPEYPDEDYTDQARRPEITTMTWRLQPRGDERCLILGDLVYRHIPRPRAHTPPPADLTDWFPLFGDQLGARVNRRTEWKLLSRPGNPIVHLFDPQGAVFDVDVRPIPRNGQFQPIRAGGRLLPVQIGWYGGGVQQGTRRDGTFGPYTVAPGYIARWMS